MRLINNERLRAPQRYVNLFINNTRAAFGPLCSAGESEFLWGFYADGETQSSSLAAQQPRTRQRQRRLSLCVFATQLLTIALARARFLPGNAFRLLFWNSQEQRVVCALSFSCSPEVNLRLLRRRSLVPRLEDFNFSNLNGDGNSLAFLAGHLIPSQKGSIISQFIKKCCLGKTTLWLQISWD